MKQSPMLSACLFPLLTVLVLICGSQAHAGDVPSADELAKIKTEATQGDADSQARLADIYRYGKGVKIDYKEAFQWASKAADQDSAKAQHYLGLCFTYGMGVEKNPVVAFEWFQKSAAQGFIDAEYRVGLSYLKGDGTPINGSKAVEWLQKSADRGDEDSQCALGAHYYIAYSKLRKAYDSDDGQIARFHNKEDIAYTDALSGKPLYMADQVAAYFWFSLAAASGNAGAKKMLELMSPKMSESAIAEAQYASSVWKPTP